MAEITRCQNCSTELGGPFCHACGQRDVDLKGNLFALFQEWGSNMVKLDGRLARTVPLFLFAPHRLAKAYLEGQRHRFTPPMRLILTAFSLGLFVMLFGTQGAIDGWAESARMGERTFIIDTGGEELTVALNFPWASLTDRVDHLQEHTSAAYGTEVILKLILRSSTLTTALLIPLCVVLLRALNPGSHLVHHILFAMLTHGSLYLVFAFCIAIWPRLALVVFLAFPVHVMLHQHAVAPGRWVLNVGRTLLVTAAMGFLLVWCWMAAIMVGVYRL